MKNKSIQQLLLICIGSLFFLSCSEDMGDNNPVIGGGITESSLKINLKQGTLPTNLRCVMYIFSKEYVSDSYLLKDSIHLDETHSRTMPFIVNNWSSPYYRFLFIALPSENAGIALSNHTNSDLTREVDIWENVRVTATDVKSISGDCYFGVLDRTSTEISDSLQISGKIKRMVGQMALDIYRVDDSKTPMAIDVDTVSTVLDRVYQIDFEYEGLTDQISFDASGEPVWNSVVATNADTSIVVQLADSLYAKIEDNDFLELSGEGVNGSVRIKGLYCLPSENNLKMKVTFHYYDTTTRCGNPDHEHTIENGCFPQKSLTLNLPQNSNEKDYLSVLSNYYTVNKAGIWLNRIIDLKYNASFELNTVWSNQNIESNP